MSIDRLTRKSNNYGMDTKLISSMIKNVVEQLTQIRELLDSNETPDSKEARLKAEKGLCTYCGEPVGTQKHFRGAHEKCYKRVNRAIHAKICTEHQAVARGWILPSEKGGRKFGADDPVGATIQMRPSRKK